MSEDKKEKKATGDSPFFHWSDQDDLSQFAGNVDSYDGIRSATASTRSYLDIEPNISVRPSFRRQDYYQFRPGEEPASRTKTAIKQCMEAYTNVGIVKNVIDLMGDFASQGITIHHKNKSVERFYRKWWEKINGGERSERFLNNLYRCGNIVINKRYARVSKSAKRQMSKAEEQEFKKKRVKKNVIPYKYDFLNPLLVEVEGGAAAAFAGDKKYYIKPSNRLRRSLKENPKILASLPEFVQKGLKEDGKIMLDPEKLGVFHYKKDDWELWAKPMINPLIDDIMMLEKMKLADMSALDGAISNIRLWRLGDLEHKILPNKSAIDKLRDILASNVGGGTMDLVWGPEIDFKESSTQIYKFLGDEKYRPVLNSIYAGLGIPPTLTGLAGQSGGYTNNFISLKTLIEKLEYGRDILCAFWKQELEYIQHAMGFSSPAVIHFDHMILSDEAAEKKLLIDLADRDIISTETLRDRFGEMTEIEETRVKKEYKKRDSKAMPPKADPYHKSSIDSDYKKIALQKEKISIDQVTDLKEKKPVEPADDGKRPEDSANPDQQGGRPKLSKDTEPRDQRTVKPTDSPSKAVLLLWATDAQKNISEILNPALLNHYGKDNLRELTKGQMQIMEEIKFKVLCNLKPHNEISAETIFDILTENKDIDKVFANSKSKMVNEFLSKNKRYPNLDELRQIHNMAYSFNFC